MTRYERQRDIVPAETLGLYTPTVVGCGAIGSQVAKQLVQMGSNVKLIDFDTVDEVNLSCQGFKESDLGKPKVEALADELRLINSEVEVTFNNRRYNTRDKSDSVLFCCVDSMHIRTLIHRRSTDAEFLIDGRMKGGDTIRIIQARASDPESHKAFAATLFSDSDASEGSCTAKTTIFGAYIAAGLMVSEYARWVRRFNIYERDYLLNIPATEMEIL